MRASIGLILFLAGCGTDAVVGPCHTQTGRACDPEIGCSDETGCNWCGCRFDPRFPDAATCQEKYCDDGAGGARVRTACRASSDCPPEDVCIYDVGCTSSEGHCADRSSCNSSPARVQLMPGPQTICDCDGKTVTIQFVCRGVEQPYRHLGSCR